MLCKKNTNFYTFQALWSITCCKEAISCATSVISGQAKKGEARGHHIQAISNGLGLRIVQLETENCTYISRDRADLDDDNIQNTLFSLNFRTKKLITREREAQQQELQG